MGFGRVFAAVAVVFILGVTGLSTLGSAAISGQDAERLGTSLVGLGDQNSDGFHELGAGAPGAANGATAEAGAVYIFKGAVDFETLSLTSANAALVIRGVTANGHAGQAIGATDWNGNGKLDLVVGEPDNGAGNVYLVPDSLIASRLLPGGSGTILLNEQGAGLVRIPGESAGDRFGAAINSRSFDADGDLKGDLLVGASQRSGARTTFYDGFEDGEFSTGPAWTQHNGHLRIENGELRQIQSGEESISTASAQTVGSWETRYFHGSDSSLNSVLRFYFLATDGAFGPGSSTARGYYLFANTAGSDYLALIRDDGTSTVTLSSVFVDITPGYHTFKVTRYPNGHFHGYFDGVHYLDATDTTYQTAKFLGVRNSADSSSSSVFVDMVKATEFTPEVLYDDFTDEGFASNPAWTSFTGTWQVNAAGQYLEATTSGQSTISTPAETGEGTWTLRFQHETISGIDSVMRFYPFFSGSSDPGSSSVTGYYVFTNTAGSQLKMFRQNGGTFTTLISTTWTVDTNFHTLKLIRDSAGYWQLYLDGTFKGEAIDNTIAFTSGMSMGFRNTAASTSANVHLDDIKIPKGPTQHGASYLFLQRETMNIRNAGSADLVRFGDRNNDHYGSAVSTSDVADLLVGAPDADFANQPSDSGMAEFIRGSSLEKVAFFDDFDGNTRGVFSGSWGPPPGPASEWELGTPVQNSEVFDNPNGDHTKGPGGNGNAWGTDLDSFYTTSFGDQDLLSPTIDLSAYTSARLVMWHAYWVEASFDFIRVAASNNAGSTFTEVYSATDHSPQEPPITGAIQWVRLVVNLDGYAGSSQVKLKIRLDQDAAVVANGWYVDDVMLVGKASTAIQTTTFPGTLGERQGTSVSSGEVTGDGVADLIIGSSAWNASMGRVKIFSGGQGPNPSLVLRAIEGESTGSKFGSAVATIRDADLGGQGDFLVGAPGFAAGAGKGYLFAGGNQLASSTTGAVMEVVFSGSMQGGATVSAADTNNDLLDDPTFGAPGASMPGGTQTGSVVVSPPLTALDPDGDTLTSSFERSIGTNPFVADTDDDVMNDGDEVRIFGTNPLLADTDGDGLEDGWETNSAATLPSVVAFQNGDRLVRDLRPTQQFTESVSLPVRPDAVMQVSQASMALDGLWEPGFTDITPTGASKRFYPNVARVGSVLHLVYDSVQEQSTTNDWSVEYLRGSINSDGTVSWGAPTKLVTYQESPKTSITIDSQSRPNVAIAAASQHVFIAYEHFQSFQSLVGVNKNQVRLLRSADGGSTWCNGDCNNAANVKVFQHDLVSSFVTNTRPSVATSNWCVDAQCQTDLRGKNVVVAWESTSWSSSGVKDPTRVYSAVSENFGADFSPTFGSFVTGTLVPIRLADSTESFMPGLAMTMGLDFGAPDEFVWLAFIDKDGQDDSNDLWVIRGDIEINGNNLEVGWDSLPATFKRVIDFAPGQRGLMPKIQVEPSDTDTNNGQAHVGLMAKGFQGADRILYARTQLVGNLFIQIDWKPSPVIIGNSDAQSSITGQFIGKSPPLQYDFDLSDDGKDLRIAYMDTTESSLETRRSVDEGLTWFRSITHTSASDPVKFPALTIRENDVHLIASDASTIATASPLRHRNAAIPASTHLTLDVGSDEQPMPHPICGDFDVERRAPVPLTTRLNPVFGDSTLGFALNRAYDTYYTSGGARDKNTAPRVITLRFDRESTDTTRMSILYVTDLSIQLQPEITEPSADILKHGWDSDADSLFDGWTDNNPKDGDYDVGEDRGEKNFGTIAKVGGDDTDADGFPDLNEVFVRDVKPIRPDTDWDGRTDQQEPNDARTILVDLNNDGSTSQTNPTQVTRRNQAGPFIVLESFIAPSTDPLDCDSDGDALVDGEEFARGTNPRNKPIAPFDGMDTDFDGLFDSAEVLAGTNPLTIDFDGDGLWDGAEVKRGSVFANIMQDYGGGVVVDFSGQDPVPIAPDLYLELDTMQGVSPITPTSMQTVINAFLNGPRKIKLHIIEDEDTLTPRSPLTFEATQPKDQYVDYRFGKQNYEQARFNPNRACIFHHGITGVKVWVQDPVDGQFKEDPWLGVGKLGGDSVMFAAFHITANQDLNEAWAWTLMHELGHNLNLPHNPQAEKVMSKGYNSNIVTITYETTEWTNVILNLALRGGFTSTLCEPF